MLHELIKAYDRLKCLFKHIESDTAWQFEDLTVKWARRAADQILDQTVESRLRTGAQLYFSLPPDCRDIVSKESFDPYYQSLNRAALIHWLISHVFFDKFGNMVILHDYGTVLWQDDDFTVDPRFDIKFGKDYNG